MGLKIALVTIKTGLRPEDSHPPGSPVELSDDEAAGLAGFVREPTEAELRSFGEVSANDGLLDDGPTVAEYVEAGHLAVNYPPAGFASRSTPEEIADAIAAQAVASTSGDDASGDDASGDAEGAGDGASDEDASGDDGAGGGDSGGEEQSRVARVSAAIDLLGEDDFFQNGKPKLGPLSDALGFRPTAEEITAAQAIRDAGV